MAEPQTIERLKQIVSESHALEFVVALFFHEMKNDPRNPEWADRDRLVLSSGPIAPALQAVLAARGISIRPETSGNSPGQGLSIAQGVALGLKLQKRKARVFCLLGEREVQEGQIWEAALSAPKFGLSNLIAIIDHPHALEGATEETTDLRPLAEKWRAFRWAVHEIDGHDLGVMLDTLALVKNEVSRPTMIISRTRAGQTS